MKAYDEVFVEQLALGIIERIPETDYDKKGTFFLPHHPVIKTECDTTKIRVVFDGSSKEGNQKFCLNDQLQEGLNTIPNIFDVLIKFRSKPVALTGDIQSAFLQIAIDANDRDKLRFLWYDDLNSEQPKLVQFKFARLMFGLKPSPLISGCVVRHHVEKYENIEPEVVDEMKDLHVDNWATSFENTE